jgi:acyl transferase domain-containing protein/NAD(P)H-dependent flavin oxidoreductase YrpB (nitropropane dioxygenase family)/acyl carrier protein
MDIRDATAASPPLPVLAFALCGGAPHGPPQEPPHLPPACGLIADCAFDTDPEALARRLADHPGEVRIALPLFFRDATLPLLRQAGVRRVWVDHAASGSASDTRFLERLPTWQASQPTVPVCGDPGLLERLIVCDPPLPALALKGVEAAGFCGTESLALLFEALADGERERRTPLVVWGGIGTAEAAAAFLALGAAGVVFESLHWLTSLGAADPESARRIAALRLEDSALVHGPAGFTARFFDKGNSRAVKLLRRSLAALPADCGAEELAPRRDAICAAALAGPSAPFGPSELIPLGPEAAFARPFRERYGKDFAAAAGAFAAEVARCCEGAGAAARRFAESPAAARIGIRWPILQGAMSCITDRLPFARAVAEAGALPTLALGYKDRAALERDLGALCSPPGTPAEAPLGPRPFALNVIALPENPLLEEQLAWIAGMRPPWTVIAAGDPQVVARVKGPGGRAAYVATNPELAGMAVARGADIVICEGCEAGGHVGTLSALVFGQAMLLRRREEPRRFAGALLFLAGGIWSRRSAFLAAMLGADGIQMGTPYLASAEIVSSGALSALYREQVLAAPLGGTVITGEASGLRVRALRTPVIAAIGALEEHFAAGALEEGEFRRRLETLGAGSLQIAARGCDGPGGRPLDRQACLCRGQFMSGAAAGLLDRVRPLDELHREVMQGPLTLFPSPFHRPAEVGARLTPQRRERFAVTAMAAANALGNDVAAMWAGVLSHACAIAEVDGRRWNHGRIFDPVPGRPGKTYCRVAALQSWEAEREALGVPPQDFRTMAHSTRLTLWLARQAIASSGILAAGIAPERIGVVVSQNSGEMSDTLSELSLVIQAEEILDAVRQVAPLDPGQCEALLRRLRQDRLAVDDTTLLGRLNCAAGGFICNAFGFRGPSFAVSAACATGLVALWAAYRMLAAGVLDAVVVGGGEERVHPGSLLEFSALRALAGASGNGRPQRCRPFDRQRDGMVLGEGGAVLVLERESLARRRGAPIHALLCGMGASNNDRGMVESLAETQAIAIRAALDDAGFAPESVGLVECHATGTLQGDREEVQALRSVFPRGSGTALSSFKSQIGHTLGASGLTSAIRGICAMRAGLLPPTLHYETPDPAVGLEEWGFRVPPRVAPWPRPADAPRRLMVNSFGFGGANYVALLEEAPGGAALPDRVAASAAPPRSAAPPLLPTVQCFILRCAEGPLRAAVLAESAAQGRHLLSQVLQDGEAGPDRRLEREGIFIAPNRPAGGGLALVFSGQGNLYPGIGRELHGRFPALRGHMEALAGTLDGTLLERLFNATEEDLQDTRLQQPALFVLEYAMARLLFDLGLAPVAMAGHSMGELTALCCAGVFTPEEGLRLVDKRARCMAAAARRAGDPGRMLAVNLPAEALRPVLAEHPEVTITNFNSPLQSVLGGASGAVERLARDLERAGRRVTLLKTRMAFHSPMMGVIRDELQAFLDTIPFAPPAIPVLSNTTRQPFPADPAALRRIVMDHLESPVHWIDNLRSLRRDFGAALFVEVGPGDTLCGFIADTLPEVRTMALCHRQGEVRAFSTAVAGLYSLGRIAPPAPPAELDLPRPLDAAQRQAACGVVQRELARFALEGVERFFKPALLTVLQREVSAAVSAAEMERLLAAAMGHRGGGPQPLADAPGPPEAALSSDCPPLYTGQPPPATPATASAPPVEEGGDALLEAVIGIIIGATGYRRDEIEPEMDIRTDLAIRSSRLPVILDAAERHFGIALPFGEFLGVRTVRQVADTIRKLLAEGPVRQAAPQPLPSVTLAPDRPASPFAAPEFPPAAPIGRYCLGEIPLPAAVGAALEIAPGSGVLVVGREGDPLAEGAAGLFSARFEAAVSRYPLDAEPPPALPGRGAAGLVVCLPESAGGTAAAGTALLGRVFTLLKAFLAGEERRFAIALGVEGSPSLEGVCGLLLTAALEVRRVRFLSIALAPGEAPEQGLAAALAAAGAGVEITVRQGRCATRQPLPAPAEENGAAPPAIGAEDVLLVSGGARGATAGLVEHLACSGCAFILLGTTPSHAPPGTAPTEAVLEIGRTLEAIHQRGGRALYLPCDVSDPHQVRAAVAQGVARFGPVSAVLHGAGILRDGFLGIGSRQDFERVVAVKLQGLRHLLQAVDRGRLRWCLALSSQAAIWGNAGQANYCAANRTMAAELRRQAAGMPGCLCKTLWLPPLAGRGMACDPEIREILEARGLAGAYMGIAELGGFVERELQAAQRGSDWIVPARALLPFAPGGEAPQVSAAPRAGREILGFALPAAACPMVEWISAERFEAGELETRREIGHHKDLWLTDHRPFKTLAAAPFSAIMALETFLEGAALLHPGLAVAGLADIRFQQLIAVGEGRSVATRCRLRRCSADAGRVELQACLDALLAPPERELAADGGWSTCFTARVQLAAQAPAPPPMAGFPVSGQELDTRPMPPEEVQRNYDQKTALGGRYRVFERLDGSAPGAISGRLRYRMTHDFAHLSETRYACSPYLLEALLQLGFFHTGMRNPDEKRQLIPVSCDALWLGRPASEGESVRVEGRITFPDPQGISIDARALDREANPMLCARGIRLQWYIPS